MPFEFYFSCENDLVVTYVTSLLLVLIRLSRLVVQYLLLPPRLPNLHTWAKKVLFQAENDGLLIRDTYEAELLYYTL